MKNIKKIFFSFLFILFVNKVFSQDNLHNFLEKLHSGNYVIDFYCDVLKSKNRDTIHKYSDIYVDREFPDPDYGVVKYKWFDMEMFPMEKIYIRIDKSNNKIDEEYFEILDHGIHPRSFTIKRNIEICFEEDINNYLFDDKSTYDWAIVRKNNVNTFYFNFDGDYLNIYLNGKKLDKNKLTQKPSGTCWDTQNSNYEEISLKKDDSKKYQFCYEFMHEYDSLDEKHKTLKTWCKIKSDAGTEYWVNKDDFDFKSKDGSNIGVVFYDRWDDFFEEIKLDKYGTYKCEKEKQDSFVKDYKLKELGINSVQDIPSNSKDIKKFYYNAESEWSDNQKITDEYVNLSPIQKKETTEYRNDLAFFTDDFLSKLSKFKLSKKNYYFNPITFLHHLDKVATPAEFNPYEKNTDNLPTCVAPITHCSGKDNPGFAPVSLTKTNYEANGVYYATINGHFNDDYGTYYHEGTDFTGSVGTPVHSFISGKVVMLKNQGTKHYGLSVLIKKDEKEDGKNIYYLLGHLSEYAPQLTINSQVYPGMVVGKVGNTGNCRTQNRPITPQEREQGLGSHLHLSFYKTEKPISKLFVNDNFITYYVENEIFESDLFNPFSHNEGRNFK